jgi:hypothetical protein
MSSSTQSLLRTITKYPPVGLGVVGTYTLTNSSRRYAATSPLGRPGDEGHRPDPLTRPLHQHRGAESVAAFGKQVSDTCLTLE